MENKIINLIISELQNNKLYRILFIRAFMCWAEDDDNQFCELTCLLDEHYGNIVCHSTLIHQMYEFYEDQKELNIIELLEKVMEHRNNEKY